MMENIKEIPYGIANFVEVAEQNMYYVDKTMYPVSYTHLTLPTIA